MERNGQSLAEAVMRLYRAQRHNCYVASNIEQPGPRLSIPALSQAATHTLKHNKSTSCCRWGRRHVVGILGTTWHASTMRVGSKQRRTTSRCLPSYGSPLQLDDAGLRYVDPTKTSSTKCRVPDTHRIGRWHQARRDLQEFVQSAMLPPPSQRPVHLTHARDQNRQPSQSLGTVSHYDTKPLRTYDN